MERERSGGEKNRYNSLSVEQGALIELSVAAVEGTAPPPLPQGAEVGEVIRLAALNYMTGIIYPAAQRSSEYDTVGLAERLRASAYRLNAYYVIQKRQTAALRALLEENEIDFVGIKGYVLGDRYPAGAVRSCADVDIYIRASERERVRRVLTGGGFSEERRDVNHDEYTKCGVTFEVHHELFFESPELNAFFGGLFERMTLREGSAFEYVMSNEDMLILQTAHAKRHFLTGGTGLRTVLDHRVARESFPTDEGGLKTRLEELGLWRFFSLLERICDALFDGGELDEELALALEYMISGGVFGDIRNGVAMRRSGGKSHSRLGYIRKRAFPSYAAMKKKYELLERAPLLLPLCYIHRLACALTSRRAATKRELSAVGGVTSEDVERMRKLRALAE